jgi:type II secretory pathway component PulF
MAETTTKEKLVMKKIIFGGVSRKDIVIFTQNLSIMLHAGLTISQALDILADQAKGRFKSAINKIMEMIMSGSPLWQSLTRFPKIFSGFYIQTIKAGETSGNLEANLDRLSTQMAKDDELSQKIKSAMFYPLIILVLGIVIALVISFVVLPKITPIFIGLKVDLPMSTRLLIKFSAFMKNYGVVFTLSLIFFSGLAAWLFKLKFTKPFTHKIFLSSFGSPTCSNA